MTKRALKYWQGCMLLSILTVFYSCNQLDNNTSALNTDSTNDEEVAKEKEREGIKDQLVSSLIFHASFDKGPDADLGKGDLKLYAGDFDQYNDEGKPEVNPGLGDPPLPIVPNAGRYGNALEFPKENTHPVGYMLKGNIDYTENNFDGTLSFWMRLNTVDIPGVYCDPIQLTDNDYATNAIWVDITKNDVPSDLRLGFFGDQKIWDPKNLKGRSEEFFWRLMKISEPPFSRDKWTHVVLTWEKINTGEIGRSKMYVNGEYRGQSGPIKEPFNWNMTKASLRLGIGDYVGFFDDIAIFDRSLTGEEILNLYQLESGVSELHE